MKYDHILKNDNIDYGVIKGNNTVVFIKLGLGSDNVEYPDKYLRMACELHEKYGYSVIVSANPHDTRSHVKSDGNIIKQYILKYNINSPQLFFFGNSNGCIKGLELTNNSVEFKKMVLVNMPLMINFHKTLQYISQIPQTEICAIYGTLDPSFKYIPFFDGRFANVKISTIPNADHTFEKMADEFIELGNLLIQ